MVFVKPTSLLLLVSLALILALAAGCAPGPVYPGPSDECGPVEPSQQDVRYALTFGQGPFSQPDWVKSYTVEPYQVKLTRQNSREGAVATLEYLLYNCGYGQAELDAYFNEGGFAIVFSNYESHALYNFCENESQDLALYEYALEKEGELYAARYWAYQQSDTRLLTFLLVFPEDKLPVMNGYARQVFPELVSCEGP